MFGRISIGSATLLLLVLFSLPSWAGDRFSNVIADAECVVMDGDVMVTSVLEQKEKIGPAPTVGMVSVFLEQHIRKTPKFASIVGSEMSVKKGGAEFPFPTPAGGERVDVHVFDYGDICMLPIDSDANAIRAVVEIEVLNSNPNRGNDAEVHTGRCVSFPNPCQ